MFQEPDFLVLRLPLDFHSFLELLNRLQRLDQLAADPHVADASVPRAADAQRARRGRSQRRLRPRRRHRTRR